MKIVSTSYSKTEEYSNPDEWLKRIDFYTGILEELAKQHKVYSIERISYEGLRQQGGVTYHFIDLKKKVERFPWKMHHLIKSLQPDVVLVNGLIFPIQIIQLRLSLGKKVKIFVLHRAEKPFRGVKKWLQVLADKYVSAYLFTSAEFGKEWTLHGNIRSSSKIHEVIQGSSVFHPEPKEEARKKLHIEDSPVYLWVGRLEKNKDPLTVVKTFVQFHKVHPQARLYMIFQTDELLLELKALIANSAAPGNIRLIGKVPHIKLQDWYSCADFIVSGSHFEGSGIAVAEAMSCGCIPIVTDIISFRKMTAGSGLLYKAGDEKQLLNALVASLQLDIENSRTEVLDQFNRELSFTAIAKKINSIIAKTEQ